MSKRYGISLISIRTTDLLYGSHTQTTIHQDRENPCSSRNVLN